jgi:hypothetical protein
MAVQNNFGANTLSVRDLGNDLWYYKLTPCGLLGGNDSEGHITSIFAVEQFF